MNENPYEIYDSNPTQEPTPATASDCTPDEYYKQSVQEENVSGEQVQTDNNNSFQSESYNNQNYTQQPQNTENIYSSSQPQYQNPYNYNTYNQQPVYNQPYVQPQPKPKKKKEKKPVTRGTIAVALVVGILCSGFLGLMGGYFAAGTSKSTDGLTISKSEGTGSSYASSGSALTTKEIVQKAADTVVEITTESVVTGSFSRQYIQEGAGSGVVISSDGYVITNHHVIENASQITVTLRNHKEYTDVKIVGTYESGDLALLKINTKDKLQAAVFGDSEKLNVGDYAVAIGNPLGQLGGTVTDGIISALDREVTIKDETMNLLQTNAEISPGNSGGGLFDGSGELIGIVNAKSGAETAEGLGFAIPINDVVDVLSDLKKYGYVKGQIDLGMSLSDVSSMAQAWMYGTNQTGVYVTSVNSGSNADKVGFRGGDIITKVNGTQVKSTSEVKDIIKKLKVGDRVTFEVYRQGSKGTLKMTLQEYTISPVTDKSDSGNSNDSFSNDSDDDNSIWNFFGY